MSSSASLIRPSAWGSSSDKCRRNGLCKSLLLSNQPYHDAAGVMFPVVHDQTRAMSINHFPALARIGDADAAATRRIALSWQARPVVLDHDMQRVAIATSAHGDASALRTRRNGVLDRILEYGLQNEARQLRILET